MVDSKAPTPAYDAPLSSLLHYRRSLHERISSKQVDLKLIESFTLPIRSGKAWKLPATCICRISTPEGPQVGDLNIWNLNNPRERFWAARTRQLHRSHVTVGDSLWSCLPYLRPMVTIIGDSLQDYGKDEFGGRCHDLLGTRCDPYVNKMISTNVRENGDTEREGEEYDYHCHSNLVRAILPFGLTEFDVHDVLNVFQVTGLDEEGRYFMRTCPAKKHDYFEFFAEIDCLCALSTCPGGDLSAWGWEKEGESNNVSQGKRMIDCCSPLKVEVFEITNKTVLGDWKSPEPSNYKGMHGIKISSGDSES